MQLSVRAVGVQFAQAQLQAIGASVEPVLRGALNTTATKGRTERYVKPMSGSIKPQRLRSALKIKRAKSKLLNARIIPSSSGIPVVNYRAWGFEAINATRARIFVNGPRGRKIAAGFVNPSSQQRLPWSTRSSKTKGTRSYNYKRALQLAQGPSAAYWFKQLTDAQSIRWFTTYLQQEFNMRTRREIAKRT